MVAINFDNSQVYLVIDVSCFFCFALLCVETIRIVLFFGSDICTDMATFFGSNDAKCIKGFAFSIAAQIANYILNSDYLFKCNHCSILSAVFLLALFANSMAVSWFV